MYPAWSMKKRIRRRGLLGIDGSLDRDNTLGSARGYVGSKPPAPGEAGELAARVPGGARASRTYRLRGCGNRHRRHLARRDHEPAPTGGEGALDGPVDR